MSVVEGVDTALSTNMLIRYATEMLHPSTVLEMGHNTTETKTHTAHMHACMHRKHSRSVILYAQIFPLKQLLHANKHTYVYAALDTTKLPKTSSCPSDTHPA